MNEQRSFYPLYTQTQYVSGVASGGSLQPSVTVAATDASATASTKLTGTNDNNYVQLRISNVSTTLTSWAYVNLGQFGAVTAATVATGLPIAPNTSVTISVDPEITGASVILGTAASAANVIFTRGEGV